MDGEGRVEVLRKDILERKKKFSGEWQVEDEMKGQGTREVNEEVRRKRKGAENAEKHW